MERLLRLADIRVIRAGQQALARPWDMLLHNERLASRVKRQGLVGLGDAYVDGWWDCASLDEMVARLARQVVRRLHDRSARFRAAQDARAPHRPGRLAS